MKRRLQALAIAMGLRAQQQKPKPEEDRVISQRVTTGDKGVDSYLNAGWIPHYRRSYLECNQLDVCSGRFCSGSTFNQQWCCVPCRKTVFPASLNSITSAWSVQASTANKVTNVGDITTSTSVGVTVGAASAGASSTKNNALSAATSTISGQSPPSTCEPVSTQRPYHADQRQQVLRQQWW